MRYCLQKPERLPKGRFILPRLSSFQTDTLWFTLGKVYDVLRNNKGDARKDYNVCEKETNKSSKEFSVR
jgi:hypothetical protein